MFGKLKSWFFFIFFIFFIFLVCFALFNSFFLRLDRFGSLEAHPVSLRFFSFDRSLKHPERIKFDYFFLSIQNEWFHCHIRRED